MKEQASAVEMFVHGRVIASREADRLSLEEALMAGHVVSRCPACGHRESADTCGWRRSALDRATPLAALRQRLRCTCGSRTVALEVWPVADTLPGTRRVYHWRA